MTEKSVTLDGKPLLNAFRDHLDRKLSEDYVRTCSGSVRRLFWWYKEERLGQDPDDFVVYENTPLPGEEKIPPSDLLDDHNKYEINDMLSQHRDARFNFPTCLEYEQNHQDRERVKRRLEAKIRKEPAIDYIRLTHEDVEAIDTRSINDFLMMKFDGGCSKSTIQVYQGRFRRFFKWINADREVTGPQLLTSEQMPDFDQIQEEVRDLSSSQGTPKGSPLRHIEVVEMLKKNRDPEARTIIMFMVKTGLRPSEIERIRLKDVFPEEQYLTAENTKTDRFVNEVVFDKELAAQLKRYFKVRGVETPEDPTSSEPLFPNGNGGSLDRKTISRRLKEYATVADVELNDNGRSKVSGYWGRHTFAYHYMEEIAGTPEGSYRAKEQQQGHSPDKYQYDSPGQDREHISRKRRIKKYERDFPTYLS